MFVVGHLPIEFIFSGGCFGSGCRNIPVNNCGGLIRKLLSNIRYGTKVSFFRSGCGS